MNPSSFNRQTENSLPVTLSTHVKKIRARLTHVMQRDRHPFARRLKNILKKSKERDPDEKAIQQLKSLEKRIDASISERNRRLQGLPKVSFPKNLPITAKKGAIVDAIQKHQVVIISGDTGCGKSTQIPKMCLEAGRGIGGKIACTQPRRIAATTIAGRIAEELGEEIGRSVGYKIRFKDRTSRNGYIKIMTDGMLLAETQQDPRLNEYDTIIVDEAHERSLNIDFILGILKTLLIKRRNLKLIITSATIDTEKFSAAFDGAPVIGVSGRRYPVVVEYLPVDPEQQDTGETTYVDMTIKGVEKVLNRGQAGDILVFMPTEQDIIETCERLEARNLIPTEAGLVLPLFARLPNARQRRIFAPFAGQKIIVSTNVAETSLTIPGIKYVIDTGLARISRYLPRTRTASLPVSPISKSSADQRKGRCGRLENGFCIRLYSQEDYDTRPEFTDPEILRSNLAEVILRMIYLRLGHIGSFPFLDRPNPRSIKDGFDLLMELGAVVRKNGSVFLTEKGRLMAKMPIDPKISRMILEAREEGCIHEVAIIASALSIQDPRERPLEKAGQADQKHTRFKDPDSDFITLLNIWNYYHRSWETLRTQNKMRKFCKEHYLSFVRMREWHHIHQQLTSILEEQGIKEQNPVANRPGGDRYAGIHRSILSGYLSNIAVKKDKNIYLAARGREAMVFPGSTLFNKSPEWIVAAEMVKTSRLFARTAAKINPEWLERLGGGLCKSSYSNPHWEKKRGEVLAWEQVSLYGLVIVPQRSVSYGSIDPLASHDIFIRSALVEGDVQKGFPFLDHNQGLIKEIRGMEEKVRRRGMLVSDDVMAEFYSTRLPGVYDIRTMEKGIKERGEDGFLKMTDADIVITYPAETELVQYPDEVTIGRSAFKFSYKFAPGKPDDGITMKVPSSIASQVSPDHLDWVVPGIFREKITALIKGLTKQYRKQLVPVSKTVDIVMAEMERRPEPLLSALGRFIYHRFGVDIPASQWPVSEIPDYLNMRVSILDHRGREIRSGKDASILNEYAPCVSPAKVEPDIWEKTRAKWERKGILSWDFGDLPEIISLGNNLLAYPGLEPAEGGVNIRLFKNSAEASGTHKKGVKALFMIRFRKDLKFLKKDLKLPDAISAKTAYFGGARTVERGMVDNITDRFFFRDIRTKAVFEAHASAIGRSILPEGLSLMERTGRVLDAYHNVRQDLYMILTANRDNPPVQAFCSRLTRELEGLVPKDFLDRYAPDRIAHLPRYLKALKIRAERGAYDREKDQEKAARIEHFTEALRRNLADISSHTSLEKRTSFEEFFWMVEEFKVSIFAQELKTPFPVSSKRLEKKLREVERMV
jgi:ATP-dependent helicase HrpA